MLYGKYLQRLISDTTFNKNEKEITVRCIEKASFTDWEIDAYQAQEQTATWSIKIVVVVSNAAELIIVQQSFNLREVR